MGSVGQPQIRLVRIAHVYYTHKNIDAARTFLADFGMKECKRVGRKTFFRGYSKEPFVYCALEGEQDEFGGAAFVVESENDLTLASQVLPGASEIYELEDAPGGGKGVTFYDPVENFPFHLVYGQQPESDETFFPELQFNYPGPKYRPGGKTQRFAKGPAPVHKLGHFGLCVTDFQKTLDFYTTYFNFYPSDLGKDEKGNGVIVFNRLKRGKELVDHHSFFFFQGAKFHVHHSSFETHDFDMQVIGHDWLRDKGYRNMWGVGRHVMGSQIFDYWYDPSGFVLEHYVDGDLVDETEDTIVSPASHDNLHVWGPDVPSTFLE